MQCEAVKQDLNQNSIQSKIYRWFYNLEIMPESLCVYFWKLTLMWITIVPVSIISLPILLFTKKFNLMDRFLGGILFYFCLFTLYLLTLPIFQMLGFVFKPKTILYDMLHVGIYLWPMVIGSSLTVGILLVGNISGGHFNPAVSLWAYLAGKITVATLMAYIVAQSAAAVSD